VGAILFQNDPVAFQPIENRRAPRWVSQLHQIEIALRIEQPDHIGGIKISSCEF
jgi:hypothetical protein